MGDSDALTAPAAGAPQGRYLIRTGADLVHLTEDLYIGLFRIMLGLLAIGSVVCVWFAHLDHREPSGALTTGLSALGLAAALSGLRSAPSLYRWLRSSLLRQQLPGALAVAALLLDGPYSPTWWLAFPLLSVMAAVASTRLILLWSLCGVAAAGGGTLLHHASLAPGGDARYLSAAAGLPVLALFARGVGAWFAGFMLRLHQLESYTGPPPPLKVPSEQAPVAIAALPSPRPPRRARSTPRPHCRLTARQLEVAMLLRDGLHHAEIARCLGISTRQVDRLAEQGRQRAGAGTTAELVAKLVAEGLVPKGADTE